MALTSEIDWALPGMEKFSEKEKKFINALVESGSLINDPFGNGWVYWPVGNDGCYTIYLLRTIANLLEIQNEPLFSSYDEYFSTKQKE